MCSCVARVVVWDEAVPMSTHPVPRCQSIVLRTRGVWSSTARARLDPQRRATGPTPAPLAALTLARSADAVGAPVPWVWRGLAGSAPRVEAASRPVLR